MPETVDGHILPHTVDPHRMSLEMAHSRRQRRLRADAETMFAAARVADRHGAPSLHNACHSLAQALAKQCDADRKPVEDIALGGDPAKPVVL